MHRRFLFVIGLFAVANLVEPSDSVSQSHPTDSTSTFIVTLSGSADLSASTNTKAQYDLWTFLMSDSTYDYVIDIESLEFTDGCNGINSVTLEEIVDDVAADAIQMGVAQGYPGCTDESFIENVDIWSSVCGTRSGSGCSTAFEECGTDWCYRTFKVDCPGDDTDPTITELSGTTQNCSGGCETGESSCPDTTIE